MTVALAAIWTRAFREWSTAIVGAGAIFHVIYRIATWHDALTTFELVTDSAAELLVGFAAAAAIGTLVTLTYACVKAPGFPKSLAPRIADLSTAIAAITVAILLAIDVIYWIRSATVLAFGHAAAVFAAGACGVACLAFVAVRWHRVGNLEHSSIGLQAVSRRALLALLPVSLGVVLWGGVRYRPFRQPRRGAVVTRSSRRPNVLLVTFDGLAAQDMSLYGYRLPTTPHLDRLGRDGIVFENFYSASTFTTPAVASFLTGLSPPVHGIVRLRQRVPAALRDKSMVRLLREQGYRTGAVVTNPAAHPIHLGLARDFDFLPPPPLRWRAPIDWMYHFEDTDVAWRASDFVEARVLTSGAALKPSLACTTEFPPPFGFDEALTFLQQRVEPYFLWVHLSAPHFPYFAPPPFRSRYLPGNAFTCLADFVGLPPNGSAYPAALQPIVELLRLRYDEFVAYADHAFGAFLATAERYLGNTVVIASADHGESFGHGFWGHFGTAVQGVVRIPLIVRLPDGRAAGTRVAGVAGALDLSPSILEIAGLPRPAWADGQSLRPMWDGEAATGRRRFAIALPDPAGKFPGIVAAMNGSLKYIQTGASDRGQLFDLAVDPGETRDLATDNAGALAMLRADSIVAMKGTAWATF